MADERTIVVDHENVQRKLQRIAHQLHEENFEQKEIVLVGIAPRGVDVARSLAALITGIGALEPQVIELELDKDEPLKRPVKLSVDLATLQGRVVVLVDDVLMSGRTLMHAAAHLVSVPLKKLTTVVLVDRRHRTFPIRADIVGLTLSTTVHERIIEAEQQGSVATTPLETGHQHSYRNVQEDHRPGCLHPIQVIPPKRRSTSGGYDQILPGELLMQYLALHLPEILFTIQFEIRGDRAYALLDHTVQVREGRSQERGQLPPDNALAAAHEAGEEDRW